MRNKILLIGGITSVALAIVMAIYIFTAPMRKISDTVSKVGNTVEDQIKDLDMEKAKEDLKKRFDSMNELVKKKDWKVN